VRLCVLIDGRSSEGEFEALVKQLVASGVDAIQLRDKQLSDRELIARARRLRAVTLQPRALPGASAPRSIAMKVDPRAELGAANGRALAIINDRPDVAAIVDADGVHLGQDDAAVKDARAIVGPRKLIGVSTHSIEQAQAAVLAGANYLGVGPIFQSKTKTFDVVPGIPLLRQVAAEIRLPAFAIGGITLENVGQVLAAGICRLAVSAAVVEAPDPAAAVKKLGAALHQSRVR
jgi:thiamine-phosphate pyrophosphorylase